MDIPECLQHLPRWGEFPIPFTTPAAKPGEKPHFRTTDGKKHNLCVRFQLCGACGKHIAQPPYYFVIGPMCVQLAVAFATPMHHPCALAALTLCPFMSRESYSERKAWQGVPIPGTLPEALPPKPPRMALVSVDRYDTVTNPESKLLYIEFGPEGSYPVQYWSYVDGTLVPESQCEARAADDERNSTCHRST